MDLVIMAAGMGSRFGGLKQIEKFGPNGEFLIDYSIYDALKYGFKRVVFIIKKENEEIFKSTIGKRVESHIPVTYVFQDMADIPVKLSAGFERVKPWGTAHAIYCCRNVVKGNFAIINADDFYGEDAYRTASVFLNDNQDSKTFAMVGYAIANTLSETGSVKRGVCNFKDGYLESLVESSVAKEKTEIIAKPLSGEPSFKVDDNSICSMNMFLFTPYIFTILEREIIKYFAKDESELLEGEFLIPDVVEEAVKNKEIKVKLMKTNSKWYGVTYKEDASYVKENINRLINEGVYPKNLW